MLDKEKLEELFNQFTIKDISGILNTSPANVRKHIKIYDLKKPIRDKNKKAIDPNLIHSLFNEGKSIVLIAKELNASYDCIANFLKPSKIKNSKYSTLKVLYATQKKSIPEISKILNISPTTIWRWIKRYNLQRHSPITKPTLQDLYLNKKLPIYQIAKKLNIPIDDVSIAIKNYDLKNTHPQISKEQILNFYPALSLKETSSILNIPITHFMKLLSSYNIPIRKKGKTPITISQEVLSDLYITQNKSIDAISTILKVSDKVIRQRIKLYGLIKHSKATKNKVLSISKRELENLYSFEGIKAVCSKFNVTLKAVKDALDKYGILHNSNKLPKERIIDLYVNTYAVYKAHIAIDEIAKELNLSRREITEFIRYNKIKR